MKDFLSSADASLATDTEPLKRKANKQTYRDRSPFTGDIHFDFNSLQSSFICTTLKDCIIGFLVNFFKL